MAILKEKYSEYQKRFSLPSFESLNKEFEIEDIEQETELLLPKIRAKIHDKFDSYAAIMESNLQPDSTFTSLYEVHYVSDEQKQNSYSVFKKLMYLIRFSEYLAVSNRDDEIARFIKQSFEEWSSIKVNVEKHIKELMGVWKKDTDIKEDLSYFG
jgi:hypothetical protein